MKYRNILGVITGFCLAATVAWAAATIFQGDSIKGLKPNYDLNGAAQIRTGSTDPSAAGQAADIGSLFLNTTDGQVYRKFGAGNNDWQPVGSADDVFNLLENPGFESNANDWTASGASVLARTTTAADIGFGEGAASWDASAASETLISDAVAIPAGLLGQACIAKFQYKDGDSNLKIQVYDGTNVITEHDVQAATGYTRIIELPFLCPSSGNLQLRVIASADAAAIKLDRLFLGYNDTVTEIANGITYFGAITWPATGLCGNGAASGWNTNAAFPADFTADTDCVPTVVGSVQTPAAGLPHVVLPNVQSGETYEFRALGNLRSDPANNSVCAWRFSDGTDSSTANFGPGRNSTLQLYRGEITGYITFTSSGNKTVKLQSGATLGGTPNCQIRNDGAFGGQDQFRIVVKKMPSSATETIAGIEGLRNWHVNAEISGANPQLSNNDVPTYTEITDGSLTLTLIGDSQSAEILCASGTEPEGTTCNTAAVNESVGVASVIPVTGNYEACFNFNSSMQMPAGVNAQTAFEMFETNTGDVTELQEGKSVAYHYVDNNGGGTGGAGTDIMLCSLFKFDSVGKKAIRLKYEKFVSAANTTSGHEIRADAGTLRGQPVITFSLRPVTPFVQLPKVLNQVETPEAAGIRICRGKFGFDAGVPVERYDGGNCWDESSFVDNGVGDATLVFEPNTWGDTFPTITCTCTTGDTTLPAGTCNFAAGITDTSLRVELSEHQGSTQQRVDTDFYLICMGVRP